MNDGAPWSGAPALQCRRRSFHHNSTVEVTDASQGKIGVRSEMASRTFQNLRRPQPLINLPAPSSHQHVISIVADPSGPSSGNRVGSPPRSGSRCNSPTNSNMRSLREGMNKSASFGVIQKLAPLETTPKERRGVQWRDVASPKLRNGMTILKDPVRASPRQVSVVSQVHATQISSLPRTSPRTGLESAARMMLKDRVISVSSPGLLKSEQAFTATESTRGTSDDQHISVLKTPNNETVVELSEVADKPVADEPIAVAEPAEAVEEPAFSVSVVNGFTDPLEVLQRLQNGLRRSATTHPSFEDEPLFTELEVARMRGAFRLFRPPDSSEVHREGLGDALILLGYLTALDEESVDDIVSDVSAFTTFSFDEFSDVAEKVAVHEAKRVKDSFSELVADRSDRRLPADSRLVGNLLEKTFRLNPVESTVAEILAATAASKDADFVDFDRFLRFVALYVSMQGFTHEELAVVRSVFESLRVPPISRHSGAELASEQLSLFFRGIFGRRVDALASDLVASLWPEAEFTQAPSASAGRRASCVASMPSLIVTAPNENILSKVERSSGLARRALCFRECLALACRVRENDHADLRARFKEVDVDGDGFLSREELLQAVRRTGITLLECALNEFLASVGCTSSERISFGTFVKVTRVCFDADGFTSAELEEFSDVFTFFDYDQSGTIDQLELVDIVAYLGFDTSLELSYRLLKELDANNDLMLDRIEFFRLMRVNRELEINTARSAFDEQKEPPGCAEATLPLGAVEKALASIGLAMNDGNSCCAHLSASEREKGLSFDAFILTADRQRKHKALQRRKRAFFTEEEFDQVRRLVQLHDKQGVGSIDQGELARLLVDQGIQMVTGQDRSAIFDLIDGARDSARGAGVDEHDIGERGSARLTVWVVVHLLREMARSGDKAEVAREMEAIKQAGFSPQEVLEFREVFLNAGEESPYQAEGCADGSSHNSARDILRRCALPAVPPHGPAVGNDFAPRVQLTSCRAWASRSVKEMAQGGSGKRMRTVELRRLLRTVGLKLKPGDFPELWTKVAELAGGDTADVGMDFAGFIRLVRWMLKSNFGDINGAAKRIVEMLASGQTSSTACRETPGVPAASSSGKLSRARARRSSVC
eukprot:TRINITY_DN18572_c0_g1_i1.p1 TRINITY_DN18572_c0_g1~~TRINITY_DN18572_c0_g1_i1.p1  ORF type:complete len:1119 (+),score=179.63 TRINITY_DN18572_c0_g1_i1:123-3479(+)